MHAHNNLPNQFRFPLKRLPIEVLGDKVGSIPVLGTCVGVVRILWGGSGILASIAGITCSSLLVRLNKNKHQPTLNQWKFTYAHFKLELTHGLRELLPHFEAAPAAYAMRFEKEMVKVALQCNNVLYNDQMRVAEFYSAHRGHDLIIPNNTVWTLDSLSRIVDTLIQYHIEIPPLLGVQLLRDALLHKNIPLITRLGNRVYRNDILPGLLNHLPRNQHRELIGLMRNAGITLDETLVRSLVPITAPELSVLCHAENVNFRDLKSNLDSASDQAVTELLAHLAVQPISEQKAHIIYDHIFERLGHANLYASIPKVFAKCDTTHSYQPFIFAVEKLLTLGDEQANALMIKQFSKESRLLVYTLACPALFSYIWKNSRIDLFQLYLNALQIPRVNRDPGPKDTVITGLIQNKLTQACFKSAIQAREDDVIVRFFEKEIAEYRQLGCRTPLHRSEAVLELYQHFLEKADEALICTCIKQIPELFMHIYLHPKLLSFLLQRTVSCGPLYLLAQEKLGPNISNIRPPSATAILHLLHSADHPLCSSAEMAVDALASAQNLPLYQVILLIRELANLPPPLQSKIKEEIFPSLFSSYSPSFMCDLLGAISTKKLPEAIMLSIFAATSSNVFPLFLSTHSDYLKETMMNTGSSAIAMAILKKVPNLNAPEVAPSIKELIIAACKHNNRELLSFLFERGVNLDRDYAKQYADQAIQNGHLSLLQELVVRVPRSALWDNWICKMPIFERMKYYAAHNGAVFLPILNPCISADTMTNWLREIVSILEFEGIRGLRSNHSAEFIAFCVQRGGDINGDYQGEIWNHSRSIIWAFANRTRLPICDLLKHAKREAIEATLHCTPSFISCLFDGSYSARYNIVESIAHADRKLLDDVMMNCYLAFCKYEGNHKPYLYEYLKEEGAGLTIDLFLSGPLTSILNAPSEQWAPFCKSEKDATQMAAFFDKVKRAKSLDGHQLTPPSENLLSTLCSPWGEGQEELVFELFNLASEEAIARVAARNQTIIHFLSEIPECLQPFIAKGLTRVSTPVLELVLERVCEIGSPKGTKYCEEMVDLILKTKLVDLNKCLWHAVKKYPPVIPLFIEHGADINTPSIQTFSLTVNQQMSSHKEAITPALYLIANAPTSVITQVLEAGGVCFPTSSTSFMTKEEIGWLNLLCEAAVAVFTQDKDYKKNSPLYKATHLAYNLKDLQSLLAYFNACSQSSAERATLLPTLQQLYSTISGLSTINEVSNLLLSIFYEKRQEGNLTLQYCKKPLQFLNNNYNPVLLYTVDCFKKCPEWVVNLAGQNYTHKTRIMHLLSPSLQLGIGNDVGGLTREFFSTLFVYLFDEGKDLKGQHRLIQMDPKHPKTPQYLTALPKGTVFASELSLADQDKVYMNIGIMLARCCQNFMNGSSTPIGDVLPSEYFALLQKLYSVALATPDWALFEAPFPPSADVPKIYPLLKAFIDSYKDHIVQEQYRIAAQAEISKEERLKFHLLGSVRPFLAISREGLAKINTAEELFDYLTQTPGFTTAKNKYEQAMKTCNVYLEDLQEALLPHHPMQQMSIEDLEELSRPDLSEEQARQLLHKLDPKKLPPAVYANVVDIAVTLARAAAFSPAKESLHLLEYRKRLTAWLRDNVPADDLQGILIDQDWASLKNTIRPAAGIVQGMQRVAAEEDQEWTPLMSFAPELLEEAIQGQRADPRNLVHRIQVNPGVEPHLVTWFKESIEERDKEWASHLLLAIAGQEKLSAGLYITLQSTPGPLACHTCSKTLDMPRFPNDPDGKASLIAALEGSVEDALNHRLHTIA